MRNASRTWAHSSNRIHGTLNHLLVGDRLWMARFVGKPLPSVTLNEIL